MEEVKRLHDKIIRKLTHLGFTVQFSTSVPGHPKPQTLKLDSPLSPLHHGGLILDIMLPGLRTVEICTCSGSFSSIPTKFIEEGRPENEDEDMEDEDMFEQGIIKKSFGIKWLAVIKKRRGMGLAQLVMILLMLNAMLRDDELFSFHLEDMSDNVNKPDANIYNKLGFRSYFHKEDYEPERFKLTSDLREEVADGSLGQLVDVKLLFLRSLVTSERKSQKKYHSTRSKSPSSRSKTYRSHRPY
jgi:hypothetical protein